MYYYNTHVDKYISFLKQLFEFPYYVLQYSNGTNQK